MRQNIPGVPFAISTTQNNPHKKTDQINKKNQYHSYQNIPDPKKHKNKNYQPNNNPQQIYSTQLMKQLEEEYENISNYKINQIVQKNNTKNNLNFQTHSQKYQSVPNSLKQYKKQKQNTNSYKNQENVQNDEHLPQIFKNIPQCDTLEDQDIEQIQSQLQHKIQIENAQQRFIKQKKIYPRQTSNKNYGSYSTFKQQNYSKTQQYQSLFANFNNQQRFKHQENFKNQQNLANNYYPKHQNNRNKQFQYPFHHPKLTQKQRMRIEGKTLNNFNNILSNNNSGKSQSNHPVFRDTLQYVDAAKYDFSKLSQFSQKSRHISAQSSQTQGPRTNVQDRMNYKYKYKKYKQKNQGLIEVIQQLQTLNETLIRDQRENYEYYENTIRSLQNLLTVKDKQIQGINQILISSQNDFRTKNLCSIDGRQLEVDNQKLKKQLEAKKNQIKNLKQSIESIDESFHIASTSKSSNSKSAQNKIRLLKTQKQCLLKKVKTLQEINSMYEQKLKEKQNRVSNMSSFNSQLQEEILKLKEKMRIQQTTDTDRQFGMTFLRKQHKNHLQLSSQLSNITLKQNKTLQQGKHPQIQNYLICIGEQIDLIRKGMRQKQNIFSRNDTKEMKFHTKERNNQGSNLNLISEFQLQESVKNKNDEKYITELKNMANKLSNFRESIGT